MGVFDTFTKRRRSKERAGKPDVFQYDNIPQPFRIQVIHIWRDAIGPYVPSHPYDTHPEPKSNRYWKQIHDTLARERGTLRLGEALRDPFWQCQEFLQNADTDGALDIIDLTFQFINTPLRSLNSYLRQETNITLDPDGAIWELNQRFREHGIGYQFDGGQLIRVDSQYVHAEVVRPALDLLQESRFRGASDEFLNAHRHYREGTYKGAIAEALKSFESTMKTICDLRKWAYPPKATAKPLIDVIFDKGLIPASLRSHFDSLRSVLESGLPTVRNTTPTSHGQGKEPIDIPDYMAAYALHLAAANIVFLVEAHKAYR